MATFPESPKPKYPLIVTPTWKTLISIVGTGNEQRKQKALFPKYNVTVRYDVLSSTNAKILYAFYMARKGAFEAFHIYDLALLANIAFNHTDEYCGTGDAAQDIFDIPGRSTSSHTVYADGIEQGDPAEYSVLTGGGAGSSDRVDFVTAPGEGAIITASFTGFLRMRVRFMYDELDRETFTTNLFRYGIELKGLGPI